MLIPIAIAINIILGQTVSAALKVPIYLDSIGTILVGVLAGPIAGAGTGGLANLIWTYVLPAPFHSDYAAPFFIVAVEIGLLAGVFGRLGFFRSRPNASWPQLAIGGVVVASSSSAASAVYGFMPFYSDGAFTFFGDPSRRRPTDLRDPRLAVALLLSRRGPRAHGPARSSGATSAPPTSSSPA